jgi:cation diffusion facilitator CzcD-associated flavoprotein CzcO
MPPAERTQVIVVGAGPSGLGTAAALARRGVAGTVLERTPRVGDVWRSRHDRLHLHTARAFSGLPYAAIPRRHGRWVGKDDYAAYLEAYAAKHALDVRLGVDVRRIARDAVGWAVETSDVTWHAPTVVVATGRYGEPSIPAWPGREDYMGKLSHAAEFRSGSPFTGMRVLVVGLGNSGAEIATELAEHGASVAISVRTPPPIARRQIAGVPLQVLGIMLSPFPTGPVDCVGAALRKLSVGDLRPYGLGEAEWGPFAARRPPVIDVAFLDALRAQRMRIVPAVTRLTSDGAVFADGSQEGFDAVVSATGYRSSLSGLIDVPGAVTEDGLPRSRSHLSGLSFVGFRESVRGQLFEARREARVVAGDIATSKGSEVRLAVG